MDAQSILLNGCENETPGAGEPETPIDDEETGVPPLDYDEICIAIARS